MHPNQGKASAWLQRLLADPPDTDQCLEWPFALVGRGRYPATKRNGRMVRVTRLVLEHFHGPPEADQQAAHAPLVCHNRKCVNPRHLRWASPAENNHDRRIDGTMPRGTASYQAKLSEAEVVDAYTSGESNVAVARRLGVSPVAVSHIRNGRSWGWLTADLERWSA